MTQDRSGRDVGGALLEQLQPFRADAVFEGRKACDVAARASQTLDEACANRIGDVREHDRHGARRSPQYPGSRTAWTEDDVRRQPNQFGCIFSSIILVSPGPTVVELEGLASLPAPLLQP